jgi:uncharacterized protein GlcG (DUF336 family)
MRRILLLSGMTMSLILSASASSLAQLAPAALFTACQTTAAATPSALRGAGKFTKMWCAVVDREGQLMLIKATDTAGTPAVPAGSDAWRGSIEIAIAKAFTALAFSSSDQALDSRTLGLLTRIDGPGSVAPKRIGTDAGVAPLFGIGDSNPYRPLTGSGLGSDDATGIYHHGLITFAGGQPVYDCSSHALLGAVGVSGDGVDQDDTVAKGAITGAGVCLTP